MASLQRFFFFFSNLLHLQILIFYIVEQHLMLDKMNACINNKILQIKSKYF